MNSTDVDVILEPIFAEKICCERFPIIKFHQQYNFKYSKYAFFTLCTVRSVKRALSGKK
jgi:hypothetical protein